MSWQIWVYKISVYYIPIVLVLAVSKKAFVAAIAAIAVAKFVLSIENDVILTALLRKVSPAPDEYSSQKFDQQKKESKSGLKRTQLKQV